MKPPLPFDSPNLRDDLPRYPALIQSVRVTKTTVAGPSGFAQATGSSVLGPVLYVAFTQQLRDDGSLLPRDREPCLVDDLNGLGLSPGYYNGRLSGSFNSLPIYTVGASSAGLFHGLSRFSGRITVPPGTAAIINWTSPAPTIQGYDTDQFFVPTADGTANEFVVPGSLGGRYLITAQSNWHDGAAQPSGSVRLQLNSAALTLAVDTRPLLIDGSFDTCQTLSWQGSLPGGRNFSLVYDYENGSSDLTPSFTIQVEKIG